MEIFELAKLLGEAIKKDNRLVEFNEAKIAYENDMAVQSALKEYEVQQQALQAEMLKEEKDSLISVPLILASITTGSPVS